MWSLKTVLKSQILRLSLKIKSAIFGSLKSKFLIHNDLNLILLLILAFNTTFSKTLLKIILNNSDRCEFLRISFSRTKVSQISFSRLYFTFENSFKGPQGFLTIFSGIDIFPIQNGPGECSKKCTIMALVVLEKYP